MLFPIAPVTESYGFFLQDPPLFTFPAVPALVQVHLGSLDDFSSSDCV